METPSYMTAEEVAERFRISLSTVRWWRHKGYGPTPIKIGKRLLYPTNEIERFEGELLAQRTA